MDNQTLSKKEKLALLLPFIGGVVFGIGPLFPKFFANIFGFPGNGADSFVYQLAGSATLGYAVVLWLAIKGKLAWDEVRYVVLATLVFNIVSLYASVVAIVSGGAPWVVYAILLVDIAIIAITTWLLSSHSNQFGTNKDVSGGVLAFLSLATFASFVFGILPLFTTFSANFFGYTGADRFIYGEAAAATLGYACMGLFAYARRNYRQIRMPILMAAVFNGLSFLCGVYQFASGQRGLLVYLVVPASLLFTVGLFYIFKKFAKDAV